MRSASHPSRRATLWQTWYAARLSHVAQPLGHLISWHSSLTLAPTPSESLPIKNIHAEVRLRLTIMGPKFGVLHPSSSCTTLALQQVPKNGGFWCDVKKFPQMSSIWIRILKVAFHPSFLGKLCPKVVLPLENPSRKNERIRDILGVLCPLLGLPIRVYPLSWGHGQDPWPVFCQLLQSLEGLSRLQR